MIGIRPQSGLANRLRALDSAVALAEKLDSPLRVLWVRTPELNARYSDLFESDPRYPVTEEVSLIRDNGRAQYWLKKMPFFRSSPTGATCLDHTAVVARVRSGQPFQELADSLPLYIETNWRFFRGPQPYHWLRPHGTLMQAVQQVTSRFSANTIGVHIRRGDNRKSIQHSPLEVFRDEMQRAVDADAGTAFFLSTDSDKVRRELVSLFGKRMHTRRPALSRLSRNGMRDALVDLLCLSRTSRIIGSYWSSFSEVAADIGGVGHSWAVEPAAT